MTAYIDREQTQAKHFILRRYLQALLFKVLRYWDVAYIDGFSGPWKSETADYSDTSFMIAIEILKDAQRRIHEKTGVKRKIRCFFSETDPKAFAQLNAAVAAHHAPAERFEIRTYQGRFEDAVADIQAFIGASFPLIFIDPTGWTGYPFTKIAVLFQRQKCEVLINFMYGFVSRFIDHPAEEIEASLDAILGGAGWKDRLDRSLPRGAAVEKLFRDTLQAAGNFSYVVSTRIDKSTADRPHFFLAYGTKDRAGLITFREIEFDALRGHARNRAAAKSRKREARDGVMDMFADHDADVHAASIEELVAGQAALARDFLLSWLAEAGPARFSQVVVTLLQRFMLRETNVKTLCADLAREGKVDNTWGSGGRKPKGECTIRLCV